LNIVIILNDAAAYFGGVLFGKHKTNFPVSPNKSWEGYLSGLFISIIAMIATDFFYSRFLNKDLFTLSESIILGIVLSIAGNLGDLAESAVKRDTAKKDSGSLLPGHGGMWDVFDAMIFSLPLFYYYLMLKGIR
jgi:phosphatidate cytidylyltransferase